MRTTLQRHWLKNLAALALVLYFGLACSAPVPGPPPGLNTVIDGMEYFAEASALSRISSQLDEYFKNVNLAFGQADAIAFIWSVTDNNLNSGYWPDIDDVNFGQQNRQTYIDFAHNHRNANPNATTPLGTFFIGGPAMANSLCTQPHSLCISQSTL